MPGRRRRRRSGRRPRTGSSTSSAASSGMPRLRSASASWARVRGASVSSRRHTCRARASGSSRGLRRPCLAASWSSGKGGVRPAGVTRHAARRRRRGSPCPAWRQPAAPAGAGAGAAVAAGSLSRRGPTPSFSLIFFSISLADVGVVAQEVPRVLLALAELVALVGVPGAGLAHDALLHAEVDQAALLARSRSRRGCRTRRS